MRAPQENGTLDLAGVQREERIGTFKILIDYQSSRDERFMFPKGTDWIFSSSIVKGAPDHGAIRESTHLDPYAVRTAFFAVESEKGALRFLSEAGKFWVWESVTYSQFREWQEYFMWLCLDPDEARKSPEGEKAWATARGSKNQFFKGTELEFTHARFSRHAELPPEMLRDNERNDEWRLKTLRRFPLHLGDFLLSSGGQTIPAWQKTEQSNSRFEGQPYAPILRIETWCVLEAIGATIYADRVHGLKNGRCLRCGKIFQKTSDHEQLFCPAPKWLKSSPCKNAFIQKKRRKTEKEEREAKQAALELRREKQKTQRRPPTSNPD